MNKVDKELVDRLTMMSNVRRDDPEYTEKNRHSVSLILEALEADDGFVFGVYGRSMSAGGALKLPIKGKYFEDFVNAVAYRALKEPNYEKMLSMIQGILSDMMSTIERAKSN